MVAELGAAEGFIGSRFVDLGCGDFSVGRELLPLCSSYTGVDIVAPLIEMNRQQHGSATTAFVHLNITADALPGGDVCLIRQVLQHLSNAQILQVLNKLDRFRWVLITEHYPTDNAAVVPNRDKLAGGDVRVYDNSGVYLTEAPFNLPEESVRQVLEVPGVGMGLQADPGVIRTYLYTPARPIASA